VSPIFVAVDTPDLQRALALTKAVDGSVGGLKLGLEFFVSNGPDGVAKIGKLGLPIFLDLKLHDIPNTVAGAMRALAPLKPAIVTVHARNLRSRRRSPGVLTSGAWITCSTRGETTSGTAPICASIHSDRSLMSLLTPPAAGTR
jgi:hypothetical protein